MPDGGCSGKGEPDDAKEGGEGEVSEKPLAIRYFEVLAYLEEAELL